MGKISGACQPVPYLTGGGSVTRRRLDVTAYVPEHEDKMDKYPPTAWLRLGQDLERRRGQLGYGYRQRGRFARERGSTLSVKTLARLENGERDSYPPVTLAAVETLYGLAPGSIEDHLAGGVLTPAEEATRTYTATNLTDWQIF